MAVTLHPTQTGYVVEGDLTFDNVVVLQKAGEERIRAFSKTQRQCVIGLGKMKEQNAVSLALMLAWMRVAKRYHVSIVFVHVSLSLRHMIEAFGLTALVPNSDG